jgi:hypothetical protein
MLQDERTKGLILITLEETIQYVSFNKLNMIKINGCIFLFIINQWHAVTVGHTPWVLIQGRMKTDSY